MVYYGLFTYVWFIYMWVVEGEHLGKLDRPLLECLGYGLDINMSNMFCWVCTEDSNREKPSETLNKMI